MKNLPDTVISMNIANRAAPNTCDELLNQYDQYGSTPPRTRIKIKNRDWDRKAKMYFFIFFFLIKTNNINCGFSILVIQM